MLKKIKKERSHTSYIILTIYVSWSKGNITLNKEFENSIKMKKESKREAIEERLKEEDYKMSDEKIEEIIDGIEKEEVKKMVLDEIITKTLEYWEIDRKELESLKRTKRINEARKAIVFWAKELTNESNKTIGTSLGLSESGISKILSRGNVGDEIQEIKKRLSLSSCQA